MTNAGRALCLPASPPPSAPSSPQDEAAEGDEAAAQAHPQDEGNQDPQLGGSIADRIGIRLGTVRTLSFGVAPACPAVAVAEHQRPSPAQRKKKRTKLELAEAEISELKEKLLQHRWSGRSAQQAACADCQVLKESAAHSEALHKRQHTYIKRQLDESKAQMVAMAAQHEEGEAELTAKHEKEVAARQAKHDKKIAALEHKLDMGKIENIKLGKDAKMAATSAAIASREAAKELAAERKVNAELTKAAAVDKKNINELKQKNVRSWRRRSTC